jgi:hypothetical protein
MKLKKTKSVVLTRLKKPTPKFFVKLRNTALTVGAVAGTIVAAPVALPAVLVKIAGYIAVAGAVASTVSQTAVRNDK